MSDSLKYLIIGGSGFIGRRLFQRLGPERAVATYNRLPFVGGVHFDTRSMDLRKEFLKKGNRFTHAFLLHAEAHIDTCAKDPTGTAQINVDTMVRIIDELLAENITPVFASSDAVFDGLNGGYSEQHATSPILTYGKQKEVIEKYLSTKMVPWIVTRFSKVVGADLDTHSLLGEWLRDIDGQAVIRCASDQIFSPADVEDVVTALIALVERGLTGLYNVCGPQPMSRLDLLNILVEELQRVRPIETNIIPCSIRDFSFAEARPLNTSMRINKLIADTGIEFRSMRALCGQLAQSQFLTTLGCGT